MLNLLGGFQIPLTSFAAGWLVTFSLLRTTRTGHMLALVHTACAPLAFHKTDTALYHTAQVANLQDGMLRVPTDENITELVIEIGCSDLHTLDDELLPSAPNAFLISFEPMLDKYAVLLARGSSRMYRNIRSLPSGAAEVRHRQNQAVPLAHHHPRGVVLPFGVSLTGGQATMHISHVAGCSSLLRANPDTKWGRFCLSVLENRSIDTINVEALAALLPRHLPIRLLKVDVQGLDVQLVRAMPPSLLRRVRELRFEAAVLSSCTSLYVGQQPCESVEGYLMRLGFRGHCPSDGRYCEDEAVFLSRAARAAWARQHPSTHPSRVHVAGGKQQGGGQQKRRA